MFHYIGKKLINTIEALGRISILFYETVKWTFRKPFDVKNLFFQLVHIGVNTLFVSSVTALFTGMVLALQIGITIEARIKGASQFIGRIVGLSMIRELGPVLTALIVAGRIGSSIAAEIGSMKITEQIDALETLATSPVQYLVVPRLISLTVMLPVLTVFANLIGILGGAVVSYYKIGIPFATYIEQLRIGLRMSDILAGLIKTVFFGIIIGIISCYKGFSTTGGAEGVGKVTTEAVVLSFLLILISDYFLTSLLKITLGF